MPHSRQLAQFKSTRKATLGHGLTLIAENRDHARRPKRATLMRDHGSTCASVPIGQKAATPL